jgi:hypothetical protein
MNKKISKRDKLFIKAVGEKLAELCEDHPEQVIQEQWMEWLDEAPFTSDRYDEFMSWRDEWLKMNPLD